MNNIAVPKFNPKDKIHKKLALLSLKAHEAFKKNKVIKIKKIEEEIDENVIKIFEIKQKKQKN